MVTAEASNGKIAGRKGFCVPGFRGCRKSSFPHLQSGYQNIALPSEAESVLLNVALRQTLANCALAGIVSPVKVGQKVRMCAGRANSPKIISITSSIEGSRSREVPCRFLHDFAGSDESRMSFIWRELPKEIWSASACRLPLRA